jgi:hypothetical protein
VQILKAVLAGLLVTKQNGYAQWVYVDRLGRAHCSLKALIMVILITVAGMLFLSGMVQTKKV